MNFSDWLQVEERQLYFDFMKIPSVSLLEIKQRKLFGPVYHGTNEENRQKIGDTGFNTYIGDARTGPVANGYVLTNYVNNIPPPIHHLGFGIYFTTSKTNGKKYAHNKSTGLIECYIDAPRLETINFGAKNTMMKWWIENGYDMRPVKNFSDPQVAAERLEATINMTNVLKSKYDAVLYKGKGYSSMLDGNQLVVFDSHNIYRHDPTADRQDTGDLGVGIGDRIQFKDSTTVGKVVNLELPRPGQSQDYLAFFGPYKYSFTLKDIKNPDDFIARYTPIIKTKIEQDPKSREFLKVRMQNSQGEYDAELERYANYIARRLLDTMPDTLVGNVYKKGTRIK